MADWHVHLTMTILPKCGGKTKSVFRQPINYGLWWTGIAIKEQGKNVLNV